MYLNYLFYLIFSIFIFSWANNNDSYSKNTVFIQPKVLEKNSEFNMDSLNFKEDVSLLFSKPLDTINNNYSLKKYRSC